MDEPVEMPIDGVLDLHTFHPRDVKDLVPEYLAACLEKGIYQVRTPGSYGSMKHRMPCRCRSSWKRP